MVSGAMDRAVQVFHPHKAPLELAGHEEPVRDVRLVGASQARGLSCSFTGRLKLWDLETGQLVGAILHVPSLPLDSGHRLWRHPPRHVSGHGGQGGRVAGGGGRGPGGSQARRATGGTVPGGGMHGNPVQC